MSTVTDVFFDAQKSSINHKSLTRRLRRIEAKHENNRSRFEEQVKQCVLRCLEVAKSEKAGLNIVKFLCTYCAATQAQESENEEENGNNITSEILALLLPYLGAKDKIVRYRANQIVSQLMGIVREIEDDLYQAIRHELGKRVRDKVPAVRLEAVCALGRLLENEMDEEAQAAQEKSTHDEDESMLSDDEEQESTDLLDKLLDVLQNDISADVRRALLLNLPIEPKTLPYLLERARDKDASVRRALYAKLVPNLGDFRHLSLSMREKLLRWGLRDRDERVRKAAAKMFTNLWIEQIAETNHRLDTEEEWQKKTKVDGFHKPDISALLELLERIDILNSGREDGVGREAMKEFWSLRPDYFKEVSFDDEFWSDVSAEGAFMARTFYDFCAENEDAQRNAEDRMPEVTRLGFHLQKHLNRVLEGASGTNPEIHEEAQAEQEFVTEQLLHITHTLDFTDEIGRRKLFGLFRQMLSMADLPEEITKLTIEALRLTCTPDSAGEKEFIAVVQESLAEVQDTLNDDDDQEDPQNNREQTPADDDSFVSAQSALSDATARPPNYNEKPKSRKSDRTPEEEEARALRTLCIHLKCLSIAHTLLQNITCDFTTNISLDTMLNTLIIPSIASTDAPIRERGIECLGLACLLSRKLAADNRDLFVHCMRKGHDELKVHALHILSDILVTHSNKLSSSSINDNESPARIDLSPFVKAFGYSPEVQSVATTCIAKVMMAGFYKLEEGEENMETREVFDNVIEEATRSGTRGCELLGKVKAALVVDAESRGVKVGMVDPLAEKEGRAS